MIYVVDLDDTLVNSTLLNNDSYNFALEQYGFDRIITNERITRQKLDFVDNCILKKIVQLKQYYFTQEWLPCRVVLNNILMKRLQVNKRENCYLWTKADKDRAYKIIDYCKLDMFFNDILFDDKLSFSTSIPKLKKSTNSNQIIIYENDKSFFFNENCKIVDHIKTNLFDINAYLIE